MRNKYYFYENLERICAERGLPISRVVVKCGLSTSAITRWKAGAMPNSTTLAKLCKFLGVKQEVFFENPENHSNTEPEEPKSEISSFEESLVESFKTIPIEYKIKLLQTYAEMLKDAKS